jgi:hypothetical protein
VVAETICSIRRGVLIVNFIDDKIRANLNLRVFLPLLAAALATTWYGLFWSVEHFSVLTNGLGFMDMQPRLTVDALFEQIRTYSADATRFYLGWSVFDYFWPLLTFTTMLFISAWLFGFLPETARRRFPWLIASAYLTVLMDWFENVGFAILVVGLPAEPHWLAQTTLLLHAGKLIFNMVFNLGFWALLIAAIIAGIKTRLGRVA